nr:enoyl-CoA hydratase/isomerase family protein [Angustibacter aerolatus]
MSLLRVFGQWRIGDADGAGPVDEADELLRLRACNAVAARLSVGKVVLAGDVLVASAEHLVTPGTPLSTLVEASFEPGAHGRDGVAGDAARAWPRAPGRRPDPAPYPWSGAGRVRLLAGGRPAPTQRGGTSWVSLVRLEVDGGIGTIRLDRPPMNALNAQVQDEIRQAAVEAGERRDVAAVVVYGGEKVFAAGADIKQMQQVTYTDMVDRSGPLQASLSAVAAIPKPTVAAITGYALGGGLEPGAVLRLPGLRRRRQGRPAGDPARHHPRRRRHAAAAAVDRPGAGQGPDLQRAVRRRLRGARHRPGRRGGRAGRRARRGPPPRRALRRWPGVRAAGRQGGRRPRPRGRPRHRARDRAGAVRRALRHPRPRDRHGVVRRARPGQGRVRGPLSACCRPA